MGTDRSLPAQVQLFSEIKKINLSTQTTETRWIVRKSLENQHYHDTILKVSRIQTDDESSLVLNINILVVILNQI